MGYTTDFDGSFVLNKPLSEPHRKYLEAFASTRRMKRNPKKAEKMPDPVREAVGLPIGPDGAYFVGSVEDAGQNHTPDIVDYNAPPKGQPGLWCQWIPREDGTEIVWDGGEKFYSYIEWLEYIIREFLDPWGYKLNGKVRWIGEDCDDRGVIKVTNNKVKVAEDKISNPLDD